MSWYWVGAKDYGTKFVIVTIAVNLHKSFMGTNPQIIIHCQHLNNLGIEYRVTAPKLHYSCNLWHVSLHAENRLDLSIIK